MKTVESTQIHSNKELCESINGSINFFPISEYISWVEMEFCPQEDIRVKLNNQKSLCLHFMYNLDNPISLISMGNNKERVLNSFQSAIVHENKGLDTFILFKKNNTYNVALIEFIKCNQDQEINEFFLQFEDQFKSKTDNSYYMHTGLPNLELGEYVKKVMEMSKDSLSERLMASGFINIILSLKLKQYLEYTENPGQLSLLTTSEIKRIQEISETINTNPEGSYNIEVLCREWGLSAKKLQLGFKEMHGKTVCNYINHIRLLKAEELLKNTNLNVSQIVYTLGWTSRSYFSKIFKEKYQCTPKGYQALLLEI